MKNFGSITLLSMVSPFLYIYEEVEADLYILLKYGYMLFKG